MRKVMIFATSPRLSSGYASASRYVSMLLVDRGYDVAIHCWNSFHGTSDPWNGIPLYGAGNTETGWDIMGPHIRHFGADTLLVIADPWINEPHLWRQDHSARVAFWFPCQAEPASRALKAAIAVGDKRLCYSQWGTRVMQEGGVEDCQYVPLGVATHIYQPLDKAECKTWLSERLKTDLTGKFIVGMVAANSSTHPMTRKAFDMNLAAFARFKQDVPEAVMYLHTEPTDIRGGIDLFPLIASQGLTAHQDVLFAPLYGYRTHSQTDAWLARLYNACDVMSQATKGEGFGLPVLEAQSCGTPVVTCDWSSMPELTAYGYVAPIAAKDWVAGNMEGWVAVPSVDGIVEGLRRAYDERHGWLGTREDGLALAARLDWANVVNDYLLPALIDEEA